MRTATLSMAAIVLAGFLASEAAAERHGSRSIGHHGATVVDVAHRGHGSYHGYHSPYRRPAYGHNRYHGYYGHHGHLRHHGYRPPVIVAPRGCGYPPVHGVYRPNYHPLNTFYYGGRNFGIGISF